jgi:hypothetical protein
MSAPKDYPMTTNPNPDQARALVIQAMREKADRIYEAWNALLWEAAYLETPNPTTESPTPRRPLQSELSTYLESNGWLRGSGVFFQHKDFPDFAGWEDMRNSVFYLARKDCTMESVLHYGYCFRGNKEELIAYIAKKTTPKH